MSTVVAGVLRKGNELLMNLRREMQPQFLPRASIGQIVDVCTLSLNQTQSFLMTIPGGAALPVQNLECIVDCKLQLPLLVHTRS